MDSVVTLADIRAARRSGAGVVRHTPLLEADSLQLGPPGRLLLKAENLQRTGSFKLRGVMARLAALDAGAGVVAGSAGNHAQAVAYAASRLGVACDVFMPAGASISKVNAAERYGAVVQLGGDSVDDAVAAALRHSEHTGAVFVHPFDDLAVVAGQGTLGLELVEDVQGLGTVIVPVGGGGLCSGVAIAVKSSLPKVRVVGVQAEACAPYATAAAHDPGRPVTTLADGIAIKRPGRVTGPLVREWLDDVVVVAEDAIAAAMCLLMEEAKLAVEGAGAVTVAALLSGAIDVSPAAGSTVAVLSGGNVDLGVFARVLRHADTRAGRRLVLAADISDTPGSLAALLEVLARAGANLIDVSHLRDGIDLRVGTTSVRVVLETRSSVHGEQIIEAAHRAGHRVARVTSPALG